MSMFHFHFQTHNAKDLTVLRQAGFDSQEIWRLCELRRTYQRDAQDQLPLPHAHLLFIRWLVQQGKLNETLL